MPSNRPTVDSRTGVKIGTIRDWENAKFFTVSTLSPSLLRRVSWGDVVGSDSDLTEAGLVSGTFEILHQLAPPRTTAFQQQRGSGSFIGGEENDLVRSVVASLQATRDHGQPWPYSPLVICGTSGTGKSLLAQCLLGIWGEIHPEQSTVFLSAADFCRSLAQAIREDQVTVWRESWPAIGMLVIDDIHHMRKKLTAQRELALLVDDFVNRSAPLVITSPAHSVSLEVIARSLASRLTAGLTIELQPPAAAARYEIVGRSAEDHRLSDAALRWFCDRYQGTVPSLLNRLYGSLTYSERPLKQRSAISRQEFKRMVEAWESSQRHSLKQISSVVSRYYQISRSQIIGSSRKPAVVQTRGLAMFLAKQAGYSLREIGAHFGQRDHSTVLHACQKIQAQFEHEGLLRMEMDELQRVLANEPCKSTRHIVAKPASRHKISRGK